MVAVECELIEIAADRPLSLHALLPGDVADEAAVSPAAPLRTGSGLILLVETATLAAVGVPAGMLVDHIGRWSCLVSGLVLALVAMPLLTLALYHAYRDIYRC